MGNQSSTVSFQPNTFLGFSTHPEPSTPHENAVTLTPCRPTISEIAANTMYLKGAEESKTHSFCPLCLQAIKTCSSNIVAEKISSMESQVKKAEAKQDIDSVSFPGIKADFQLTHDNWSTNYFKNGIVRSLTFQSQTKDSPFQAMLVVGDRNGSVSLIIKFNQNYMKKITEYFSQFKINLTTAEELNYSYTSNSNTTQLLFEIIAKYSKIPADMISFIKALVTSGKWETVTPPPKQKRSEEPLR